MDAPDEDDDDRPPIPLPVRVAAWVWIGLGSVLGVLAIGSAVLSVYNYSGPCFVMSGVPFLAAVIMGYGGWTLQNGTAGDVFAAVPSLFEGVGAATIATVVFTFREMKWEGRLLIGGAAATTAVLLMVASVLALASRSAYLRWRAEHGPR